MASLVKKIVKIKDGENAFNIDDTNDTSGYQDKKDVQVGSLELIKQSDQLSFKVYVKGDNKGLPFLQEKADSFFSYIFLLKCKFLLRSLQFGCT